MVLIIDNYDSFTFNLVQLLGELGCLVQVVRNDEVTLADIEARNPERIVISPGPGTPNEAGLSNAVITHYAERLPLLGVCLGHQCLGQVYGARVIRGENPVHGKTSSVYHQGKGIFRELAQPFTATRYNSLVVQRDSLPEDLEVVAETSDGAVMGLHKKGTQAWGVQFHPESVLTLEGKKLLKNFLEL